MYTVISNSSCLSSFCQSVQTVVLNWSLYIMRNLGARKQLVPTYPYFKDFLLEFVRSSVFHWLFHSPQRNCAKTFVHFASLGVSIHSNTLCVTFSFKKAADLCKTSISTCISETDVVKRNRQFSNIKHRFDSDIK